MADRNRRRFECLEQRISCELHHRGYRTTGMIRDISASGMLVRTSTGTAPRDTGSEIRVGVKGPDSEPFEWMARLARAHVVRRELVSAADGGFGLEVTSAPEEFYLLVQSLC